jgi:hypothetical protein
MSDLGSSLDIILTDRTDFFRLTSFRLGLLLSMSPAAKSKS